jgi:hypothetical protein
VADVTIKGEAASRAVLALAEMRGYVTLDPRLDAEDREYLISRIDTALDAFGTRYARAAQQGTRDALEGL